MLPQLSVAKSSFSGWFCAANHLAGDLLPTLHRGARSAVLSRFGLSMGGDTREDGKAGPLRLSSALPASAAAFNSQMGGVSQRLGAPVSFMAALLNLRLGLWMPAPRSAGPEPWLYRHFPGLYFFSEAFNAARADEDMLHLSDGGHFENLAACELIRRRCRYVVIVDASADPQRDFNDPGNLIRRVREDFGVEVKLDARDLIPKSDGYSRASAVAGSIRYSDDKAADHGLLIYIKPSITGDEPSDILQYHQAKAEFPHEGTSDQLFDEAQWESYRRLGEFIGCETFGAVEELPDAERGNLAIAFNAVRQDLTRTPWNETAAWNRLSDLTRKVEADMAKAAGGTMLAEAWPEVAHSSPPAAGPAPAPSPPAESEVLSALVSLLTSLEEVYIDTDVSHPAGDRPPGSLADVDRTLARHTHRAALVAGVAAHVRKALRRLRQGMRIAARGGPGCEH